MLQTWNHGRVVDLRPFAALRPPAELAALVAAPPYDVIDVAEARAITAGNPDSFVHISRPEVDLPPGPDGADADPHSAQAYAAARAALDDLVARGVLRADAEASYYAYRQHWRHVGGVQVQTGIVGCAAVADYLAGDIRIHEYTRPDKEDDRLRHIDALDAHDEPVFLMTAPDEPGWQPIAAVLAATLSVPADLTVSADDVDHELWPIPAEHTATLAAAFAAVPRLYVADGHHRSAAAARLATEPRAGLTGDPATSAHTADTVDPGEVDAFLTVVFPGEELAILAYQRVVADLAGLTPEQLLIALGENFEVSAAAGPVDPAARLSFGMYLAGSWYHLSARPGLAEASDPVARLDVSVLQDRVLAPLLGIDDPRTDRRIAFVGGIRGLGELQRRVDDGLAAVAFALHPTSVAELVAVADAGQVMPPKSTWFEPKLRSGLFVHQLHPLAVSPR